MNRGMTLVEVIIAMALLSIITLIMFMVVGTSVIGIFNFGNDTKELFSDIKIMEEVISVRNLSDSNVDVIFQSVDFDFNIPATGSNINVTISGSHIQVKDSDVMYFLADD
ncbi:MAG: type II secretion system protein [Bacillota bacterium]|nr:type II secretion system protein [Bacillota bacterium]